MPVPVVSVTDVKIFTALRTFLLTVVDPAVEVIRTQANRTPLPKGPNWIAMTPVFRSRLEKGVDTWDYTDPAAAVMTVTQNTKVEIQLDVYGPLSPDIAAVVSALLNDTYACDYFAAQELPLAPLYATDGRQMPLVNGEEQYEQRWTMTLALQANLAVSTPQDFADTLTVGLINVDVEYPPGA